MALISMSDPTTHSTESATRLAKVETRSHSVYYLATQILTLIQNAKFEVGHHLREQHLADMLDVSRTPIRQALKLLAEHGIVETRKYHGYVLVKPFHALQSTEIKVPLTLEQLLYQELVRDRLAGKLPNSLTQNTILQRYKVERPVAAQTLQRMAKDGLITPKGARHWEFLPTLDSRQALKASYELRATLEPAALLLPEFKVKPLVLERIRMQHLYILGHPRTSSISHLQIFEADSAFHEALAEFSGNIFFLQVVQRHNQLRRLLEFSNYNQNGRILECCREHLAILDAINADNMALASRLMRDHLTHAQRASDPTRGSAPAAGSAAPRGEQPPAPPPSVNGSSRCPAATTRSGETPSRSRS